mmetsp:Transcript_69168/g.218805  ORF Transcript_69168/g.218805 Transcript_69168/m.218805 type:complete len:332 (-) Transcript_69168:1550-2545(-)
MLGVLELEGRAELRVRAKALRGAAGRAHQVAVQPHALRLEERGLDLHEGAVALHRAGELQLRVPPRHLRARRRHQRRVRVHLLRQQQRLLEVLRAVVHHIRARLKEVLEGALHPPPDQVLLCIDHVDCVVLPRLRGLVEQGVDKSLVPGSHGGGEVVIKLVADAQPDALAPVGQERIVRAHHCCHNHHARGRGARAGWHQEDGGHPPAVHGLEFLKLHLRALLAVGGVGDDAEARGDVPRGHPLAVDDGVHRVLPHEEVTARAARVLVSHGIHDGDDDVYRGLTHHRDGEVGVLEPAGRAEGAAHGRWGGREHHARREAVVVAAQPPRMLH